MVESYFITKFGLEKNRPSLESRLIIEFYSKGFHNSRLCNESHYLEREWEWEWQLSSDSSASMLAATPSVYNN